MIRADDHEAWCRPCATAWRNVWPEKCPSCGGGMEVVPMTGPSELKPPTLSEELAARGPWSVLYGGELVRGPRDRLVPQDHFVVAVTNKQSRIQILRPVGMSRENFDAVADIIATAPEMLAALRDVVARIDRPWLSIAQLGLDIKGWRERFAAIIAKAEGEP